MIERQFGKLKGQVLAPACCFGDDLEVLACVAKRSGCFPGICGSLSNGVRPQAAEEGSAVLGGARVDGGLWKCSSVLHPGRRRRAEYQGTVVSSAEMRQCGGGEAGGGGVTRSHRCG